MMKDAGNKLAVVLYKLFDYDYDGEDKAYRFINNSLLLGKG